MLYTEITHKHFMRNPVEAEPNVWSTACSETLSLEFDSVT